MAMSGFDDLSLLEKALAVGFTLAVNVAVAILALKNAKKATARSGFVGSIERFFKLIAWVFLFICTCSALLLVYALVLYMWLLLFG